MASTRSPSGPMTQWRAEDAATPPTTSEKETLSEVVPSETMDAVRQSWRLSTDYRASPSCFA